MKSHKCPAFGCDAVVPKSMLMCRDHWYMVPTPMQKAVWRSYRAAPGGVAHLAAIKAAIKAVNAILEQGRERWK